MAMRGPAEWRDISPSTSPHLLGHWAFGATMMLIEIPDPPNCEDPAPEGVQ